MVYTLKKLKEDIHDGEMYSHTSGQESVHTTDLPEEKQYKSEISKMTGRLKGFTAEGNARESTAMQQTNRRSAKLTRGHSRWWKPKAQQINIEKKRKKREKGSYWSLEVNRIKKQKKIKNEEVMIVVLDCHGSRKHILELQS